jgi:prepilin-type N-terminal cleavage/methylation domain-containing protein
MRAGSRTVGTKGKAVAQKREVHAFTLIELLVVIAVIAVLASLLLPVSGAVSRRYKMARVNAELNQLVTAIEAYKFQVGSYPPDNDKLRTIQVDQSTDPKDPRVNTDYLKFAALNPLFYELMGAVFSNKTFYVQNQQIDPNDLKNYFGSMGIQNSARTRSDIPYKGFSSRGAQHKELNTSGKADIELLAVPVKGPSNLALDARADGGGPLMKAGLNPWYYDSSSTNRHNSRTFDLWAEIVIGRRTNIIGNWKE